MEVRCFAGRVRCRRDRLERLIINLSVSTTQARCRGSQSQYNEGKKSMSRADEGDRSRTNE